MPVQRQNPPLTVAEILEAHANNQIFESHGYKYQFSRVKPDARLTIEDCMDDWPFNAYGEAPGLVAECGGCLVIFDMVGEDDPREVRNLGA